MTFPANLTPAEHRCVLALIEHGRDKAAADSIDITTMTLRTHTRNARHKAGVNSTLRLVVLYLCSPVACVGKSLQSAP